MHTHWGGSHILSRHILDSPLPSITTAMRSLSQPKQPAWRSSRVQDSKRHFKGDLNYMPSVSRSGGIDVNGNALLNHETQATYRKFIDGKLGVYHKTYPNRLSQAPQAQIEAEMNILILFRKLREGVVASKRLDSFALEVYETSIFLSIIFDKPEQASPLLATLLRDFYPKSAPNEGTIEYSLQSLDLNAKPHTSLPEVDMACRRNMALFLHLLDLLISYYPSQSLLQSALSGYREGAVPAYLSALAVSARRSNYIECSQLLSPANPLFISAIASCGTGSDLGHRAILQRLGALRGRIRQDAWRVLRSTYREINIGLEGSRWLMRCLLLDSTANGDSNDAEAWMISRVAESETILKTGTRWSLTRPS